MFIDKESIKVKINGMNDFISLGNYILDVKFGYNKLWGEDSGRNLAGDMVGTMLGVYPKLIITFRKMTKSELETIVPILDSAVQTVKYYDPYKKAETIMTTYTGDYEVQNKNIIDENKKSNSFSCSFISKSKRR